MNMYAKVAVNSSAWHTGIVSDGTNENVPVVKHTTGARIGGTFVDHTTTFTGEIAEIILFNGNHDEATRTIMASYILAKWGV